MRKAEDDILKDSLYAKLLEGSAMHGHTVCSHTVLGLLFLRHCAILQASASKVNTEAYVMEGQGPYEVLGENVELTLAKRPSQEPTLWPDLQEQSIAKLGELLDHNMRILERRAPNAKAKLPQHYANLMDDAFLAELASLVNGITPNPLQESQEGGLSEAYASILDHLAYMPSGTNGTLSYVPMSVATLMAELLAPHGGRVYGSACGSGNTLLAMAQFMHRFNKQPVNYEICGQDVDAAVLSVAYMNLAIHGIRPDLTLSSNILKADEPSFNADFITGQLPFMDAAWGNQNRLVDKAESGMEIDIEPAVYYNWLYQISERLTPNGTAAILMPSSSLLHFGKTEKPALTRLVEHQIVDGIVSLPGLLLHHSPSTACIWLLSSKNKTHNEGPEKEICLIDARRMGTMQHRRRRLLNDQDITEVAETFRSWQRSSDAYKDIPGFCRAVRISTIKANGYSLMPGQYVGVPLSAQERLPFDEEMRQLTTVLIAQFAESKALAQKIEKYFAKFGNSAQK